MPKISKNQKFGIFFTKWFKLMKNLNSFLPNFYIENQMFHNFLVISNIWKYWENYDLLKIITISILENCSNVSLSKMNILTIYGNPWNKLGQKIFEIWFFKIKIINLIPFASIYDFTAHWEINNEQMAVFWKNS